MGRKKLGTGVLFRKCGKKKKLYKSLQIED